MQKLIFIKMKIGVIVAMDKELQQLQHLFDNNHVIVEKCGIGKVNAAVGTVEMLNAFHPDIIISTGCAGGAGEGMEVTDVVVGTRYTYHDVYCGPEVSYGQFVGLPALFDADERLLQKATTLDTTSKIHAGLMVSGDWFVDSREKMREILGNFPIISRIFSLESTNQSPVTVSPS